MSANDRQKKIFQHLSISGNGMDYDFIKKKTRLSLSLTPPPLPPSLEQSSNSNLTADTTNLSSAESDFKFTNTLPQSSTLYSSVAFNTPTFSQATSKERKRQILDHLKRSSKGLKDFSAENKRRNSKIMEHLRQSLS